MIRSDETRMSNRTASLLRKYRRYASSSFVAGLALWACAAYADSNAVGEGIAAYDRGDFAQALHILAPEAQAGDPAAQFHLGLLYARGEGTEKDPSVAARWFEKAAEQGNAHAQYIIGHMYAAGDGVQRDLVQAYKWLSIAASQGWWKARETRERLLSGKMSPQEISRAQRQAGSWLQHHGIPSVESDE